MFDMAETPGRSTEKETFQWNLEHIAELRPVHIDDKEIKRQMSKHSPDEEAEVRAQKAIDYYFQHHMVAPSPWNEKPPPHVLPVTPAYGQGYSGLMEETPGEKQGSIQRELARSKKSSDKSCQTMLTLPIDFDLEKVLGEHMSYQEAEDNSGRDSMSSSSLRRKLFFNADASSILSPVKTGHQSPDHLTAALCTPPHPKKSTPEWERLSPIDTPSSVQFSSSPIRGPLSLEGDYPRTSFDLGGVLASPELSPIADRRRGRSRRSQGLFGDLGFGEGEAEREFGSGVRQQLTMDVTEGNSPPTMPCPDVSPIGCFPSGSGQQQSLSRRHRADHSVSTFSSPSLQPHQHPSSYDSPMSPLAIPFSAYAGGPGSVSPASRRGTHFFMDTEGGGGTQPFLSGHHGDNDDDKLHSLRDSSIAEITCQGDDEATGGMSVLDPSHSHSNSHSNSHSHSHSQPVGGSSLTLDTGYQTGSGNGSLQTTQDGGSGGGVGGVFTTITTTTTTTTTAAATTTTPSNVSMEACSTSLVSAGDTTTDAQLKKLAAKLRSGVGEHGFALRGGEAVHFGLTAADTKGAGLEASGGGATDTREAALEARGLFTMGGQRTGPKDSGAFTMDTRGTGPKADTRGIGQEATDTCGARPKDRGAFTMDTKGARPEARGAFTTDTRGAGPKDSGAFTMDTVEAGPEARGAFTIGPSEAGPEARRLFSTDARRTGQQDRPAFAMDTGTRPRQRAMEEESSVDGMGTCVDGGAGGGGGVGGEDSYGGGDDSGGGVIGGAVLVHSDLTGQFMSLPFRSAELSSSDCVDPETSFMPALASRPGDTTTTTAKTSSRPEPPSRSSSSGSLRERNGLLGRSVDTGRGYHRGGQKLDASEERDGPNLSEAASNGNNCVDEDVRFLTGVTDFYDRDAEFLDRVADYLSQGGDVMGDGNGQSRNESVTVKGSAPASGSKETSSKKQWTHRQNQNQAPARMKTTKDKGANGPDESAPSGTAPDDETSSKPKWTRGHDENEPPTRVEKQRPSSGPASGEDGSFLQRKAADDSVLQRARQYLATVSQEEEDRRSSMEEDGGTGGSGSGLEFGLSASRLPVGASTPTKRMMGRVAADLRASRNDLDNSPALASEVAKEILRRAEVDLKRSDRASHKADNSKS